MTQLIKNAFLVNEGKTTQQDLRIQDGKILTIAEHLAPLENEEVVDAAGKYLLPGLIDDQVHFREPGLTQKACIKTESRAAVAGGITSFIENVSLLKFPSLSFLEYLLHMLSANTCNSFATCLFIMF